MVRIYRFTYFNNFSFKICQRDQISVEEESFNMQILSVKESPEYKEIAIKYIQSK